MTPRASSLPAIRAVDGMLTVTNARLAKLRKGIDKANRDGRPIHDSGKVAADRAEYLRNAGVRARDALETLVLASARLDRAIDNPADVAEHASALAEFRAAVAGVNGVQL